MFQKYKEKSSVAGKRVISILPATSNVGRACLEALMTSTDPSRTELHALVRQPKKVNLILEQSFSPQGNASSASRSPIITYPNSRIVLQPGHMDFQAASTNTASATAAPASQNPLLISLRQTQCLFLIAPGCENRVKLVTETAKLALNPVNCPHLKLMLVLSMSAAPGATSASESTIFGREFAQIEEEIMNEVKTVSASATTKRQVGVCFLRVPLFIDNYWMFKTTFPEIRLSVNPIADYCPVALADVGFAAAKILTDLNLERHFNKTYSLASDRINFNQVTSLFNEILGRSDIVYRQVTNEQVVYDMENLGFAKWQMEGLNELSRLINCQSQLVNPHGDYLTDIRTIINNDQKSFLPITVRDWIIANKNWFIN